RRGRHGVFVEGPPGDELRQFSLQFRPPERSDDQCVHPLWVTWPWAYFWGAAPVRGTAAPVVRAVPSAAAVRGVPRPPAATPAAGPSRRVARPDRRAGRWARAV